MENFKFSREIVENFDLTTKHLFKKKAGAAKYYYQLSYDETLENDLEQISKLYNESKPFKIFGMHTNLYITENGFNGLFIDTSSQNSQIVFDKENEEFTVTGNALTSQLVNFTMDLGYDFASLTGIPGMVGSGIVGNSSWATGKDFGAYVKKIKAFDFKECKEIELIPDKEFFATRNSFIKEQNLEKTRYFVKEVILKSEYIGKDAVKEKYSAQMNKRRESLKYGFMEGCAGSIWSNIDLKEKTGKSFRLILESNPELNVNFNGARYSDLGSKFFTTDSNTSDKDVAKLLKYTVDKLQELYNIKPTKEVCILDYDGEIDLDTFLYRNYEK